MSRSFDAGAMPLIDSKPAFEQRCQEVSAAISAKFAAQGISTLSKLAYSLGTPGSAVDENALKRFAGDLEFPGENRQPTRGFLADVRRLHFEACTLVLAELKTQVTASNDPDGVKHLPFVEKTSRWTEQQGRLSGLSLTSEHQPAHRLVDMCFAMVKSGALVYLCPSKCISREQEICSGTKDSQVVKIENRALVLSSAQEELSAEIGNEVKLLWALQRRGLAMDQVGMLSWKCHEAWTQTMFKAMNHAVAAGFSKVSMAQALRADREVFVLLAQEVTEPIRYDGQASGNDPLFERLCMDPRVVIHFTPLPHCVPSLQRSRPKSLRRRGSIRKSRSRKRRRRPRS